MSHKMKISEIILSNDVSHTICCDLHRRQLSNFVELSRHLPSFDVMSIALYFARQCTNNPRAAKVARRLTISAVRFNGGDDASTSTFSLIDRLMTSPTALHFAELTGRSFRSAYEREDLLYSFQRYFRAFKIENYTIMPYPFDVQLKNRPLSFESKQETYERITSMRKIYLEDTKINHVHRNRRIELQAMLAPFLTPRAVNLLAQDDKKRAIRVTIYNWHTLVIDRSIDQIVSRLKEDYKIIIGNPYVKMGADKILLIRVDNPRFDIWFEDYEKKLKEMNADQLRELANDRFEQNNNIGAAEYYTLALEKIPSDIRFLNNRAECYLQANLPKLALSDCEKVIEILREEAKSASLDPTRVWKTYFRMLRALISLKSYTEAIRMKESFFNISNSNDAVQRGILNRFERLIDVEIPMYQSLSNGNYNLNEFSQGDCSHSSELYPEFELENAFEFRQCEQTNKGFGLFATRRIECGTLLIVERPFAFVHGQSNENLITSELPLVRFALTRKFEARFESDDTSTPHKYLRHPAVELLSLVEEKILSRPEESMKDLSNLLPFRNMRQRESYEDEASYKQLPYKHLLNFYERNMIGTGIWLKLSRFNHSCLPNCYFLVCRHFVFVSTLRTIENNEELTINYLPSMYNSYVERTIRLRDYFIENCSCELCVYDREVGQIELQQICRLFDESNGDEQRQRYWFKCLLRRFGPTRPLGFIEQMKKLKTRVSTKIFSEQVRNGYLNDQFILQYLLTNVNKFESLKPVYELLKSQFSLFNWKPTNLTSSIDELKDCYKTNIELIIRCLPEYTTS